MFYKNTKNWQYVYANTDFLLEKIDTWHNNSEKSSTAKIYIHTACGYLLFTHCLFDSNKNKHNYHSEDSREHATKIINCEKLKMPPLTKEDKKKTHRRFFSKNKIHWKV